MIPRHAGKTLEELAKGYPAIAITGPRQSGKTTLARHVFASLPYLSLENPDTRLFAESDPRGFLERYRDGAVFDEVQRYPELLSYLQGVIDEDPVPGRFVLTGSQQFGLMSRVTQSLAGRVAMVQLLPFSLHELYSDPKGMNLDEVMFNGLYPPVHDRKLDPAMWCGSYIQTYIERDVRQMVNVKDLTTFQRFVRLCAARVGQLLNLSGLASDCGITHNTAKAWISILEASYIIFLLQPHHENLSKRLIKTPKLYFIDTGLAAWLLAIQNAGQLNTHPMRGALFESFIIAECFKSRYNRGLAGNMYFWRDRSGNEVDLIFDLGNMLRPMEIKSGKTITPDAFKGMSRWVGLAGTKSSRAAIVYGGDGLLTHGGIEAIPWYERIDV